MFINVYQRSFSSDNSSSSVGSLPSASIVFFGLSGVSKTGTGMMKAGINQPEKITKKAQLLQTRDNQKSSFDDDDFEVY